jgi:hypothetical protein
MAEQTIHVQYRSWKVFERDCRQQLALKGLFLKKTDLAVEQFAPVVIRLVTPDGEEFVCPAEVVQCVAGQGLAVQFTEAAASVLQNLMKKCPDSTLSEETVPGGEDPIVGIPESVEILPVPGEKTTTAVESPVSMQQLESMSVAEKRQAALHGRKDIRMLLIRDRNKTIHPFILKNPAITLDEIEQIAKMPSVNPDVLRMIANHKEWTRSATVCRNLVRNPQTPMKEALELLAKLPVSEVRALAKGSTVRTAIQQAARKKITS